jgi:flagellum-specific peptidoglycan hydrolase FlgJ
LCLIKNHYTFVLCFHHSIFVLIMMTRFDNATPENNIRNTASPVWMEDGFIWKMLVMCGLAYLIWSDRVSIEFKIDTPRVVQASIFGGDAPFTQAKHSKADKQKSVSAALKTAQSVQCDAYIARFSPVAMAEQRKFGIPASIILAQGLLESDAGKSHLASKANNHFGIKCFSRCCQKGHCINATDDSHKDFFVKYPNVWGSYRAHSLFLKKTPRYAALFRLDSGDYQGWAKGLSRAGYATDKRYAQKLIDLIEVFDLTRFDKNKEE